MKPALRMGRGMNRWVAVLGTLAIVVPLSACSSSTTTSPGTSSTSSTSSSGGIAGIAGISPTPPGPFASQADNVVADLAVGHFTTVEGRFDPTMVVALPLSSLEKGWTTFQQVLGAYRSHVAPASVRLGVLDVERVPVTMAHAQGEVRVTFHPNGTIAGLYFLKADAPPPQSQTE